MVRRDGLFDQVAKLRVFERRPPGAIRSVTRYLGLVESGRHVGRGRVGSFRRAGAGGEQGG
jgi:hypothetical protein